MQLPAIWTRETWRRAAAPTVPSVVEQGGRLVAEGTSHYAVVNTRPDVWAVDYLPGRLLTRAQAVAGLRIAVAPDRPEVARWAALLGLTAAEATGFAALPVGVTR